jgi:hypothetical protein
MLAISSIALLGLSMLTNSAPQPATDCVVMRDNLAERPSRLDSISFPVGGGDVKICYGRPSARGRTMIGGDAVPYGSLWRTGANEPTMIHTAVALSVAGIEIEPGSYSLYTVPGQETWQVIVNRSITQWGHEGRYTSEVEAQEVGRATVMSERLDDHVETLTLRSEPSGDGATLFLEWERTRVTIPIQPAG